MKKTSLLTAIALLACVSGLFAQKIVKVNLSEALKKQKLTAFNRKIEPLVGGKYEGIKVSEENGEGLIWLKNENFSEGTIEFDVKGKDVLQRSFIGVAFHAQNDSTYDAIYFRPFNFYAKDSIRYIHAVQYISHPQFPWKKLRETRNGEFEKAIPNAPDPNDWFHAKVVVSKTDVKVFIANHQEPVLSVQKLNTFSTGQIGLFVGDGSGGEFANLSISKR